MRSNHNKKGSNKVSSNDSQDTNGKSNNAKRRARRGNGSNRKSSNSSSNDNSVVRSNSFDNDPSWYSMYPALVDSTARISTGYPIGINYNLQGWSDTEWNFINDVHTMRLYYTHGIGLTETDRDPVNLAATKLYSYVRHANSGHSNYERTDLMLYFLATIEAYNLIALAIRAYGVVNTFNNMNRAMPKHVVNAIGWDYDNLVENAARLRTEINNMIARVNSLYIPTELNIIKRWWWLNTTIFTDSTGPKSMNYVCTPNIYRVWEEMSSEQGGYLKTFDIPSQFTITTWKQAVSRVLDHILDSEDIGIMSGDILKAYGDRVFTLSMIDENYVTPFVYSEEVLMQINNTSFVGTNLTNLDITQVTNNNLNSGLRYEPRLNINPDSDADFLEAMRSTPVMSFSVNDPDNTMVMVASRNISMVDDYFEEGGYATINAGSEIFTHEVIYRVGSEITMFPSFTLPSYDLTGYCLHLRFDHSPLIKLFNKTNREVIASSSHYENVVPVDERTVSRMHDTALLSLFSALV